VRGGVYSQNFCNSTGSENIQDSRFVLKCGLCKTTERWGGRKRKSPKSPYDMQAVLSTKAKEKLNKD
jgi:hypothetical protein